jgi:Flp pilus assembly protein TadB
MDKRTELLTQMSQAIIQAAAAGTLTGNPIQVFRAEIVAGPRAGAGQLYAGLATAALFNALAADRSAMARQFITWPFRGDPSVYLDGQALRIEAPWPKEFAQDAIRLGSVCRQPKGNGRWVLGINEYGQTVIGGLNDATPNWLLAGTTGSGKTVALLSSGLQLSWDPLNRLVLIDGKLGAGLGSLVNLPGVVGPLATDTVAARNALGWVYGELQNRYRIIAAEGEEAGKRFNRLVILFDEFQEFTADPLVAELLRRIVSRGRSARVHTLLATQHPTVDAFGDDNGAVKRNLPGRIALKVLDAKASEVVVGAPAPRADRLTGAGDAYAIGGTIHRTQLLLVDRRDLDRVERQPPALKEWPEFQAEEIGQEPAVRWSYTGGELAYGLAAAYKGWGRPALVVAGLAVLMGAPALALAGVVIAPTLLWQRYEGRRDRFRQEYDESLAECAQLLREGFAATGALRDALDHVVRHGPDPAAADFREAWAAHATGTPLEDAWTPIVGRRRNPFLRMVVEALTLKESEGGDAGEVLLGLETMIRDQVALKREIVARQATARLESTIVSVAPLGFFAAIKILPWMRAYEAGFYSSSLGQLVLALAVVFSLIAFALARRFAMRGLTLEVKETAA